MINPVSPIMGVVSNVVTHAIKPIIPVDGAPAVPSNGIHIDMSKDIIVLWVPGTSEHSIREEFRRHAKLHWGSEASLNLVDYKSTWEMSSSYKDGLERLKSVLEYIRARLRPGQKVMLAGESQGAMIAGEVLAIPEYAKIVDRAVLIGHPGVSPHHYDGTGKVLEINNPLDPTTFKWDVGFQEITDALEKLVKSDFSAIPTFLKVALKNPVYTAALILLQGQRIPSVAGVLKNTHDYRDDMVSAVLWLKDIH